MCQGHPGQRAPGVANSTRHVLKRCPSQHPFVIWFLLFLFLWFHFHYSYFSGEIGRINIILKTSSRPIRSMAHSGKIWIQTTLMVPTPPPPLPNLEGKNNSCHLAGHCSDYSKLREGLLEARGGARREQDLSCSCRAGSLARHEGKRKGEGETQGQVSPARGEEACLEAGDGAPSR